MVDSEQVVYDGYGELGRLLGSRVGLEIDGSRIPLGSTGVTPIRQIASWFYLAFASVHVAIMKWTLFFMVRRRYCFHRGFF